MGASVSNNVADQISSITNNISQNTVVNQTQIDNTSSAINLTQCNITAGANVNMSILNKNIQTAKQIVSATQNSTVTNDIQQKLLQEASSTVGSLGLGYADASNASSQMANASTTISNAMNVSSNQISITQSDINCTNSTITAQGSVAFTIGSDSNFISNQTVKNSQVTNVANTISQTAQQKATAYVQGLTGFLLGIALIIIAVGFTAGKTGNTAAIQIIIVIIVIGIILFMYIKQTPPFFDKDLDCVIGGRNGSTIYDSTNCVDVKTSNSTVITQPPLRYLLPIIDVDNKPNLCQVAISIAGNGTNNNGYNQYIAQLLFQFSSQYQPLLTLVGISGQNPFTNGSTFILSLPTGNPGIPIEYRIDMGNGSNNNNTAAGSCTPGFLMWQNAQGGSGGCGSTNGPTNCYYDPNAHSAITNDFSNIGSTSQLGTCPQAAYVDNNITTSGTPIQNMAWLDISSINVILYNSTTGLANLQAQMALRFVLCSMINKMSGDDILPLNIYMNPSEYVTIPIQDVSGNTYTITNTAGFITSMIIDPSGQSITMLYNTTSTIIPISNNSITLTYDPSGTFYSSSVNPVPLLQSITLLVVPSTNPPLSQFSFTELSNLKNKLLHYQPTNGVCGTDFNLPCVGSPGTISAQTGKVNNNAYKFHKFSNIVLISVLGLLILYFIISHFFKGSGNKTTGTTTTSSGSSSGASSRSVSSSNKK